MPVTRRIRQGIAPTAVEGFAFLFGFAGLNFPIMKSLFRARMLLGV